MSRLVVVSNRIAVPTGRQTPPGGLAVAVLAALKEYGGIWYGWSGEVSQLDTDTKIVNKGNITYAMVDLLPEDHDDYYNGFCNSVLWPLCHYRPQFMEFSRKEWEAYNRVNEMFARKLVPLLQPDDLIWAHDYHLFSLAHHLRLMGVTNRLGFFLHIPFPAWGLWRSLPCYEELLTFVCEYDLVGFQTNDDLIAFYNCVKYGLGVDVGNDGAFKVGKHPMRAQVFPIGIDVQATTSAARKSRRSSTRKRLIGSLRRRKLIVGIDRLDYSKGLLSRFLAYERLLELYPHHRRNCVFLQVAPESRKDVEAYDEIRRELEEAAGHINGRFADFDWAPIRYLNRGFNRGILMGILRAAQVGLVTPLRDGMNLVAKEYVACQDPRNPGVLVLSSLAGASRELSDGAVMVNPFDLDGVAEGLEVALQMPLDERIHRWRIMMKVLRHNDIRSWRISFVTTLQQWPT
ncbi:MAG: trehalose-6-phosphate synthase [Arenicellales bacterium]|nr:trehalose-6-phosphate synthase [Arenicellales bacterium]